MVLRNARKFTPEVLLSASRPDAGTPNHDASKVIYSVSSYSFEKHEQSSELRMLDAHTGESKFITDDKDVSDAVWLDSNAHAEGLAVVLRTAEKGTTQVLIGEPENWSESHYLAGTVNGPIADLKVTKIGEGYYGFAVSAAANPNGSLHNAEREPKPHTSARLYNTVWVRHWDRYLDKTRQTIFIGALVRRSSEKGRAYLKEHLDHWIAPSFSDEQNKSEDKKPEDSKNKINTREGSYFLTHLSNPLVGTDLESPIPVFGGRDNFDISRTGLTFVAKDPALNIALHTKCNLYFVPLSTYLEETPEIHTVRMKTFNGAMTSPVFSNDGAKVAFLFMREDGYESDKNQLFVMEDVWNVGSIKHLLSSPDGNGSWSRSPSTIQWSHDDKLLYLVATNKGQKDLFHLPSSATDVKEPSLTTFQSESIADFKPLANGNLFLATTSFVENRNYSRLLRSDETSHAQYPQSFFTNTNSGANFGLSFAQIESIWTPSATPNPETKDKVHCWVMKPSNFNPRQKYPMALLVHGGPQGAWENAWSTRWNPAVYAEQGYLVVMPNITGSTGYGQHFTDAIKEQSGGLPYEDLVKVFAHFESEVPYADTSRAVALGASYGGFMMNWIQGHDLGRKFKALVTHDGIFSDLLGLSTEELYFMYHDVGGPWHPRNREKWLKWDPSQYTQNWKTPHLIIHSDLDYRLTMSDGLAAFNVLQTQGVESQLLNFPDENHWVLKPENSLRWHGTVINWINRHVGLPVNEEVEKEILMNELPGAGAGTGKARIKTVDCDL